MTISVVVNTLNEEKNIRACLETVKWADEIIIVDMYSDDKTTDIAREYTQKIFMFTPVGYVEPARNFALEKATGEWVLVVDADERVTPQLRDEILALTSQPTEYAAFKIPFQEYMFGKFVNYGSWQYQKHIRLVKKQYCEWPTTIHTAPIIKGPISELQGKIEHYSHLTISHWMKKLNKYTEVEAQEWFEEGVRVSLFMCFYYGLGKFLKEWIYYRNYKDGSHGLILAALYGMYYFVARIKLWELWYKHDHNIADDVVPDMVAKQSVQMAE